MGLTAKQVIKILKKNGWKLVRIKGSHHHFLKEGAPRPVTVPVHGNKDLGTFADQILKEAGINPKEVDS
ncbi:MAG: type II toxin-antitoxin system HicA family toxin [Treponema sp.]|jgi:predicted RNA binding protein YcfA (HicA-like mRNA interferase family)|nr:type II toxin-antitoxin system HicA family toxin [Treponema sp.]